MRAIVVGAASGEGPPQGMHDPRVEMETLAYLRGRTTRAKEDSREAIDDVPTHATTRGMHDGYFEALVTKTQILWAPLDAAHPLP